jgi:hypothetical protein
LPARIRTTRPRAMCARGPRWSYWSTAIRRRLARSCRDASRITIAASSWAKRPSGRGSCNGSSSCVTAARSP